jgi:hypothetical protein
MQQLKPIENKHLPRSFYKAVILLRRPYTYISEQRFLLLRDELENCNSDIFEDDDGKQYTIGGCDNGHFAIMPLIKKI